MATKIKQLETERERLLARETEIQQQLTAIQAALTQQLRSGQEDEKAEAKLAALSMKQIAAQRARQQVDGELHQAREEQAEYERLEGIRTVQASLVSLYRQGYTLKAKLASLYEQVAPVLVSLYEQDEQIMNLTRNLQAACPEARVMWAHEGFNLPTLEEYYPLARQQRAEQDASEQVKQAPTPEAKSAARERLKALQEQGKPTKSRFEAAALLRAKEGAEVEAAWKQIEKPGSGYLANPPLMIPTPEEAAAERKAQGLFIDRYELVTGADGVQRRKEV